MKLEHKVLLEEKVIEFMTEISFKSVLETYDEISQLYENGEIKSDDFYDVVKDFANKLKPVKHIPIDQINPQPVFVQADKLSTYQKDILKKLRSAYPNLDIQIGIGERLLINGNIIKGIEVNLIDKYNLDIDFFIQEIRIRYLEKLK